MIYITGNILFNIHVKLLKIYVSNHKENLKIKYHTTIFSGIGNKQVNIKN